VSYIEKYNRRLTTNGTSVTEAMINKSKLAHNRDFATSPSFYQVMIDGILVDTIINKTTNYDVKKIHFRNNVDAYVGGVVEFKDSKYLIMETDSDEIYTFAKMEKCNGTFSVQTGIEKVVIGRDPRGKPIYGETVTYSDQPCIIKSTYFSANENDSLPLPEGKLNIFMKYQIADNIKVNYQFKMYDATYKISDIRYSRVINNVGVMEVSCERVVNES